MGLAGLCSGAAAQQKQIDKLQKWYDKGLYSTALDRANYFLIKYDREAEIHLYAAFSCERMLKLGYSRLPDSTLLHKMTTHVLTAHQLDPKHQVFARHKVPVERIETLLVAFAQNPPANYPELQQQVRETLKKVYGKEVIEAKPEVEKEAPEPKPASHPAKKNNSNKDKGKEQTKTNDKETEPGTKGPTDILKYAESFMGTPYKYAGCDPDGFDCSGFTYYVFKHFDIELPRSSSAMAQIGKPVGEKEMQPGDLVFFGSKKGKSFNISHVGIVHTVGEGAYYSFIHSSSRGVVVDDPMTASWDYWQNRYLFTRRLPNL